MVVGKGMLDGACPGDVFAAPPMDYVLETAKLLASDKGVLLLVNNYTGDKMAFEMAAELAEAEGLKVKTLFIDDDVAVQGLDLDGRPARRGRQLLRHEGRRRRGRGGRGARRAGPHRREGQLGDPDDGHRADRVHAAGQGLAAVRARRRRDGDRRRHPRRAGPRRAKLVSADEIVDVLLGAVVPDLPYASGDEVALMVNGLGGTPISELYLLYGIAHEKLAAQGITVGRSYVGEYCTSLDMAGASLTLVKLDDEIKQLLLAPAEIANRVF